MKKLALNKQTMALLDDKEMTNVKGGLERVKTYVPCPDNSATCPGSASCGGDC